MANLSEDIQCAGSDTRPPMLDRTDFASWQQRIRLYCRGKENGVNILKSIDEGPFQMGTFRETLAEGNEDKDRYNADIRATNILLQGLPKDIYSLINHYTDAKDIWDNVKMLLEGSELTKEDRESQTLNSKFVNNMLPEWGRFVTAVKLNRGLRDSNYDQLYAYLKQHEAHANENKMLLDRFTQHTVDPLALMSNVAPQQTSSNPRNQATVQDDRVVVQNVQGRQNRGHGNNARGAGTTGYGGAQNRVGNANPGQARQVKCYNCNAQENGVALDEEQLLFLADPVYDERWSIVRIRTFYLSTTTIQYQDAVFVEHHEEHEMHDDILKEQRSAVVQSHVSSVPNDAYMMIYNDMYEPHAQSVSKTTTKLQKLRAENGKIKQHYKEMYDSIKITRAKNLEHTTALLTKNESLKVQIQNKLSCVNKDHVKPKVLAPGKYVIDVEPIPPRNRNNREVHLVYLNHLKESVETLREIVEEAKVERPLDSSLALACRYTKHS
ncbi:hypothetical protein Tco_0373462 [Tanacetum coccineum]